MKFKSQADEIRYYTKKLLDEGEMKSVKEIKSYVFEKSQKKFSDGAFAGALRDLIMNSDEYTSPSRGIYCRSNSDEIAEVNESFEEEYKKILKDTSNRLIAAAQKLNPLTISMEQQKQLSNIKEILDKIDEVIK